MRISQTNWKENNWLKKQRKIQQKAEKAEKSRNLHITRGYQADNGQSRKWKKKEQRVTFFIL